MAGAIAALREGGSGPSAPKRRKAEEGAAPVNGTAGPANAEEEVKGVAEVRELLTQLGLLQYLPNFVATGFDLLAAVQAMEESDMLEECGMSAEHAKVLQQELIRRAEAEAHEELLQLQFGAAAATARATLGPLLPLPTASSSSSPAPATGFGRATAALQAPLLHPQAAPPFAALATGLPVGAPLHAAPAAVAGQLPVGGLAPVAGAPPGEDLVAMQAEANLMCSMQTGMAGGQLQGGSVGGAANVQQQLYALAQLAEESAQMNASAAAFCAGPIAEPFQVAAVSEASAQAAQRAAWAAQTVANFEVEHGERLAREGNDVSWLATVKQVTQQAADTAEQSAQNCKIHAAGVREQCLDVLKARKSKVPCKNHLAGRCTKGSACEFSHDAQDMQPRPLMLKSMKQCIFFAKGNCVRGPACPFSHGEEESAEIEKYVESLRKEKKLVSGATSRR